MSFINLKTTLDNPIFRSITPSPTFRCPKCQKRWLTGGCLCCNKDNICVNGHYAYYCPKHNTWLYFETEPEDGAHPHATYDIDGMGNAIILCHCKK